MASAYLKPIHAFLLPVAFLAGCASTPKLGGDPQLKVYPGAELPAPDRFDMTAETRAYYVGPYDKLSIDVFGIPELSQREVQVSETGKIYFPPVAPLDVSGKTVEEIGQLLTVELQASHVREPQVSVALKEANSQTVTIDGDAVSPGVYPIMGKMTLLRAMALAKGSNEFANLRSVVVFRTVKGQKLAALYDVKAIRQGLIGDPEIFANDLVVVGDSQAKRLFKDLATIIPLVTTPIILIQGITN